tara:strand:- start:299 stop:1948 length:1650 start_codon:yes stop_codon:yes gene_type:complete
MKIIAETAFNHNGDVDYLINLVREASKANADYVTVQIMDTKSFCVKDYERYETYINTEITQRDWIRVFEAASESGIDLIPCVLEEESFKFCYDYGFEFFKIHATDITNKHFLEKIADKNCKVILETQCASNFDINFALEILGKRVVCLIHGFSDYPTELENLNLNALDHMKKEFNLPVGLADHTLDTTEIPLIALSKGCKFLEKHITLSRDNRNFDWQVSLYPEEFLMMTSKIKHYSKSLGIGVKHPTERELSYRSVLYKKFISGKDQMLRSDSGYDFITESFRKFKKQDAGIAVIARLKSKRLKEKVLKHFCENALIVDLCNRVSLSQFPLYLATSDLKEDKSLVSTCEAKNIQVFKGHPKSVLDRMLWLAYKHEWGSIFRVTGDNPFTDPELMKKMHTILVEKDLDYVRVNGAPFGLTAELFSTSYLWSLYLKMKNPMTSEYLSWFVLNDENAKMGSLNLSDLDENIKFVNLSVDYEEDLTRCLNILKSLPNKPYIQITFSDVIENIDVSDIMEKDKEVKLPENKAITLKEYVSLIDSREYHYSEDL